MIQITQDQFSAFESKSRDEFCRRAFNFFRIEHPDTVDQIDDAELRDLIDFCVTESQKRNIKSDHGIICYTFMALACGRHFADHPDIRQHMTDPNPEERLEELVDFYISDKWSI